MRPEAPIKKRKPRPTSDKGTSNLQSLQRAIDLLKLVTYSDKGHRLTNLAEQAELSKSTAHRILRWLVEQDLLQFSENSMMYTPGGELYRLGQSAARFFSLADIARPYMKRIADETEDTVYLSVIDGDEAVCVERVIGNYPIKTLTLAVGDRRPLGVGAGAMALLAALPPKEAQIIIDNEKQRIDKYSGFDTKWLQRAVANAKRKGYSYNPERVLKGMSAIGVAISSPSGQPICAISVAAISSRMKPVRRNAIVKQLQQEGISLMQEASLVISGAKT